MYHSIAFIIHVLVHLVFVDRLSPTSDLRSHVFFCQTDEAPALQQYRHVDIWQEPQATSSNTSSCAFAVIFLVETEYWLCRIQSPPEK